MGTTCLELELDLGGRLIVRRPDGSEFVEFVNFTHVRLIRHEEVALLEAEHE